MNEKTKRILSMIALAFVCIATVTFIPYLINPDMLDGAIKLIFFISAALGGGLGLPIIILTSMERKAEERRKLCEDIERAEAAAAKLQAEEIERNKLKRAELSKKINDENNKK